MSGVGDPVELAERGRVAKAHLDKVATTERTTEFYEAYCIACAWSDYDALLASFDV